MPDRELDLLQGTLDVLVLKTLTWKAMHGYEVARWINQATDGTLQVLDGALYTALHRLEQKGWVEAEWGLSEKGKRAKYYQLTSAGRQQLVAEDALWRRYAAAVTKVLDMTPAAAAAMA